MVSKIYPLEHTSTEIMNIFLHIITIVSISKISLMLVPIINYQLFYGVSLTVPNWPTFAAMLSVVI